jgi:cell wall-associated NlpC family hydrolase
MKKTLLIILLVLLSACGSTPQRNSTSAAPHLSIADDKINELIMYAVSLADTPYHYGGNNPENGFDCSGFVDHVFRHSLGIVLPRTSRELSRIGSLVKATQLQPGDLVFFNTQNSLYSHVGIYIGDDKFVHAPKTGSHIRVDKMKEKYWISRYNGARRINL